MPCEDPDQPSHLHFQGRQFLSNLFFLSSKKGFTLNGKNIFPSRVNPFQKGTAVQKKQTGSYKRCYLVKIAKNVPCVSSSLKCVRMSMFLYKVYNIN